MLEQASVQANRNVEILRSQIEEAELAIGNVEQNGAQHELAAAPSEALGSLRRRVQEAGLAVPGEEGDRVFVRACRAAIQARLADGEARIRRLTSLVEEVRMLPSVGNDLAELAKRRHRAEREQGAEAEALRQAEAGQSAARELLQESEARRVRERAGGGGTSLGDGGTTAGTRNCWSWSSQRERRFRRRRVISSGFGNGGWWWRGSCAPMSSRLGRWRASWRGGVVGSRS